MLHTMGVEHEVCCVNIFASTESQECLNFTNSWRLYGWTITRTLLIISYEPTSSHRFMLNDTEIFGRVHKRQELKTIWRHGKPAEMMKGIVFIANKVQPSDMNWQIISWLLNFQNPIFDVTRYQRRPCNRFQDFVLHEIPRHFALVSKQDNLYIAPQNNSPRAKKFPFAVETVQCQIRLTDVCGQKVDSRGPAAANAQSPRRAWTCADNSALEIV